MADLNNSFFDKLKDFDIPDIFSLIGPFSQLFSGGDFPTPPNLSDIGINKGDISSFFNLKRSIGRAGIQRQGAQATRTAVGNLPSSLRQSTIPASISSGIQSKVGDQIAQLEAQLGGEEMQSLFQLFNVLNQQFQNELSLQQAKQDRSFEITDILSLLPLAF